MRFTRNTFSFIESNLSDEQAQTTLSNYADDLPLFKQIADKGTNGTKRKIRMYFTPDGFIGYLIYTPNVVSFNEKKKLISKDEKSSFNTININNVEVRKSIREDESHLRYGYIIIDKFLVDMNSKCDGLTLQASNPELVQYYKKQLKFTDLKTDDYTMVKWFKKQD